MLFNEMLVNLRGGQSTVYSVGSAQKHVIALEKVDGKETGLQEVKASGGKVSRKIAENILLSGIQGLLVRKGVVEFGGDGLLMFCQTEQMTPAGSVPFSASDLQARLIANGVETRLMTLIVRRFLKAIDSAFTASLTDLQAIEVLQAVCQSEAATAQNIKRADEKEHARLIDASAAFNDAVLLAAEKAAAALKAAADEKAAAAAAGV